MPKVADDAGNSSSCAEAATSLQPNLNLDEKQIDGTNISGKSVADYQGQNDGKSSNCVFSSRGVQIQFPRNRLHKVPYLETALSGRFVQQQDEGGIVQLDDLNPALLRPILDYARTGRERYLFAHLSRKESVVELFEAVEFLCLPAPAGMSYLDDRLEHIAERMYNTSSRGNTARDALVLFALAIHHNKFNLNDHLVRNKIFQKVLFVLENPAIFVRRMRTHFMEVFTQKVKPVLTKKQITAIESWDDAAYELWDKESNPGESRSESEDDKSLDGYYDSDYDSDNISARKVFRNRKWDDYEYYGSD